MTLGSGIFLSAIFLGCVFLYIKSDNKSRWRRVVLWLSVVSGVSVGVVVVYLVYESQLKGAFSNSSKVEESSYSVIKDIKLGESLTDLQFRHGKFIKVNTVAGYVIYNTEPGVLVWEKNGKAERLSYNCRQYADSSRDYTSLGLIGCGYFGESILKVFNKENVEIKCVEKDVEQRYYEIKKHNVGFILSRNRVIVLLADNQSPILRPNDLKNCD